MVADDVDSACLKQRQSSRELSLEETKQTFAKQQARLLAEHAKAMSARDREFETLEEECRDLTQHIKAALDTRAVNSAIYEDKTELEKLQLGRTEVECDAVKPTLELCGRARRCTQTSGTADTLNRQMKVSE